MARKKSLKAPPGALEPPITRPRGAYTLSAVCQVCGIAYFARQNMGRRARVCTSPRHTCRVRVDERLDGRRKVISCTLSCCRSKYKKAASTMADQAIDTRKFLSNSEYEETLRRTHQEENPYGIALRFILETGCRLGEALLVRAGYLEWKLEAKMSIIRMPTLKKQGHPLLPIHLDNRRPFSAELQEWVKGKGPMDLLFPVEKRTLQRHLERILDDVKPERAGLIHLLRHTRASRLVRSGMPLTQIRKELRWASLELLKIYVHSSEDEIADAFDKI